MDQDERKKESKIEKLPLETRRLIFWIVLIISAAVLVVVWIFSLNLSLSIKPSDASEDVRLEKIKSDLKIFFQTTGEGLQELKNQFSGDDQSTSTVATTSQEIIPSLPN
ncbi:MAG: hypothetical protein JW816_00365 [Candidatus Buchananbacteria bacterium]|nr:hypothetical protein [Candidatus Buchananbacteria bacterium]